MKVLYKYHDGDTLVVVGHFTKSELFELKMQGYRVHQPNVNKNGIPVM